MAGDVVTTLACSHHLYINFFACVQQHFASYVTFSCGRTIRAVADAIEIVAWGCGATTNGRALDAAGHLIDPAQAASAASSRVERNP